MLKIWKNQFFFHTPRVQLGKEDSGHTVWSLTDHELCCLFRGLGTTHGASPPRPPASPGKGVLSLSVSVAAVVKKHEYTNKLGSFLF